MSRQFLDFEQPIEELNQKIHALRMVGSDNEVNLSEEIARLEAKSEELMRHIYSLILNLGKLRRWQGIPYAHKLRIILRIFLLIFKNCMVIGIIQRPCNYWWTCALEW